MRPPQPMASHEIRTPLNAVIGMAHILRNNQPREDQQEQLDVLMFSAGNLLSIVNNMLDYTKIEEGRINSEQIEMNLSSIALPGGSATCASRNSGSKRLDILSSLNTLTAAPLQADSIMGNNDTNFYPILSFIPLFVKKNQGSSWQDN